MIVKSALKVGNEINKTTDSHVLGLCPDPENLIEAGGAISLAALKRLENKSILSAELFDKELVSELCKIAAALQLKRLSVADALNDKIMATVFFEASTRTRLSFESAMLRLGGKTISVAEAASTGIAKGEHLTDIGQMLNSYADIVAVRHGKQKAMQEISQYLRIPMINSGNGSDEHPTQALADWYALLKWNPCLAFGKILEKERVHLGILGTPGSMRSVKSFLVLSLLFKESIKQITIVSELADPLGREMQDFCNNSPIPIHVANDLQEVVGDLDVIYMNSIAFLGDGYRTMGKHFSISAESPLKKNAVILHPLTRGVELDTNLDDTRYNLYFNQADGAVFIRQALLLALFGRLAKNLPKEIIS